MNDEDAFQAQLDANPDDHTCRLVFADWLDERGDPRAEGYRAMGRLRVSPCYLYSDVFDAEDRDDLVDWELGRGFWWCDSQEAKFRPHHLPHDWVAETHKGRKKANRDSRREAEDAAALAFAALPAERRADLLATVPA